MYTYVVVVGPDRWRISKDKMQTTLKVGSYRRPPPQIPRETLNLFSPQGSNVYDTEMKKLLHAC